MTNQQNREEWENDFNRRSNLDEPLENCSIKETLLVTHYYYDEGEQVLDYPESIYELDPEKVKDFIRSTSQSAAQEAREEVLREVTQIITTMKQFVGDDDALNYIEQAVRKFNN